MEDEYHFLNICPPYQEKKMSPIKIFMFLINPPSRKARIQKLIAEHIFECLEKRKGEDAKSKYSRA